MYDIKLLVKKLRKNKSLEYYKVEVFLKEIQNNIGFITKEQLKYIANLFISRIKDFKTRESVTQKFSDLYKLTGKQKKKLRIKSAQSKANTVRSTKAESVISDDEITIDQWRSEIKQRERKNKETKIYKSTLSTDNTTWGKDELIPPPMEE